jgi:hypothetical protein
VAFVADEVDGTWGDAIGVPGLTALGTGGLGEVLSVSCMSAGNCTAGGYYRVSSDNLQAFVVGEAGGTWGNAIEVPGSGTFNTGGLADVTSVSCMSAGNCAAGGLVSIYSSSGDTSQPFVDNEVNGTWGEAIQVPGFPSAGTGGVVAGTPAVSCGSAGNCVEADAGFVASQVNGTWGEAIQVPGIVGLASCPPTGGCTAAGSSDVASQN